jgi:hypothetical protein
MTRAEQLSAMTEEDKRADLLRSLEEYGCVRLTSRQAVQFWGAAVDWLADAGKVKVRDRVDHEGQYSWIEITPA